MKTVKKFKKIYIEITNICNLNCPFCNNNRLEKEIMTSEQFAHIIKEIKPYTDYIYLHVKGEPFLHPHLKEILDIAHKNTIFVNITTNGTLLKENYELILNSPIRQINVSLHSILSWPFEEQENYLDTLSSLIIHNEEKQLFYLSIRTWINKDENDYQKSNILLERLKQKIGHINHLKTHFSEEQEFIWPSLSDPYISHKGRCMGGITHIGVLTNGEVVLCCLDSLGKTSLGNIFDTPFKSIIENGYYQQIINNYQKHILTLELCHKCQYNKRF